MLSAIGFLLFVVVELLFAFFIFIYAVSALYSSFMGSAYIPTKDREIQLILKKARLKKGKLFMDLGCGDGRSVIYASSLYKVRAIGVDVNPVVITLARAKARVRGTRNLSFKVQNIMNANIEEADYIYLFLMPDLLKRLAPKLRSEGKKGLIVISHGFQMPDWSRYLTDTINHEPFPTYFYKL